MTAAPLVRALADLDSGATGQVGGKNASLGEMTAKLQQAGIRVPAGFATMADAYWQFLDENDLRDEITRQLDRLKTDRSNLAEVGQAIREAMTAAALPSALSDAVADAYSDLARALDRKNPPVAVRSSATAAALPQASCAGQLDSFLNIRGEKALLDACKRCMASLFTDRAIIYRENNGFDHMKVALSVGVQQMVRADTGGAGVMFSIDTETGFPHTVLITAAWGLGETVVQGKVEPDEYHVFKPFLEDAGLTPIIEKARGDKAVKMIYARGGEAPSKLVETSARERGTFVLGDAEILQLARWAAAIERHYDTPMDVEWARDGDTGDLYVVQARPETVQSQMAAATLKSYRLGTAGERLASGLAIGDAIAAGPVCRLASADEIDRFSPGSILVTRSTDPDWVPIMKKAAAIVTDHGGRTSHAAIVSRELGLPAIVGAGGATEALEDGRDVTVSCAEGDTGSVYAGTADFSVEEIDLSAIPETDTRVMINLANPAAAYRWWRLPTDGVGLARMEFIIGNIIKVHPMALARFDALEDKAARKAIEALTRGYEDKCDYFIDRLARGAARIAAVHYPNPMVLRMSDFKTNEYAQLIGGAGFEPAEENPMLGWRGASRYYDDAYRDGFALECRAVRRAREEIGLTNIVVMIPFCRTVEEADKVLAVMAEEGLIRGRDGLEVFVMCEIPANIILADGFAARFDGFSIGSNDLTQLVLGVDRDSEKLRPLFDERDPAVMASMAQLIETTRRQGTKTGICGQAPSDYPELARFLVAQGIDSISVTPDSFLAVKRQVAEAEAARRSER